MPTMLDAVAAIRARLDAAWVATPVVHEGRAASTPSDQAFLLCEVAVSSSSSFASIGAPGARLVRRPGQVLVHVFVPIADADPDTTARTHAAAVASIFEGADVAGVVCRSASYAAGAKVGDAFWRVTVSVPFVFDEIV